LILVINITLHFQLVIQGHSADFTIKNTHKQVDKQNIDFLTKIFSGIHRVSDTKFPLKINNTEPKITWGKWTNRSVLRTKSRANFRKNIYLNGFKLTKYQQYATKQPFLLSLCFIDNL